MKTILLLIAPLMLAGSTRAQELKTDNDKTLYALGALLGQNVVDFKLSAQDLRLVQMGLKDSVIGAQPKVDLQTYGPKVREMHQSRVATKASGEKQRSKSFLETMAKEKGALKLPNGAIVIPMKEGKGASPKASDKVKVHYHGTLVDGTVFDSSVKRGEPAEFPLNGVIPCWTEGLQKIKIGGKAKLVCPSDVAYGDQGRPPTIPGGAALVFEVELLEIVK